MNTNVCERRRRCVAASGGPGLGAGKFSSDRHERKVSNWIGTCASAVRPINTTHQFVFPRNTSITLKSELCGERNVARIIFDSLLFPLAINCNENMCSNSIFVHSFSHRRVFFLLFFLLFQLWLAMAQNKLKRKREMAAAAKKKRREDENKPFCNYIYER